MLTVSRDRLVSMFLAGLLGGVLFTWACGPGTFPDSVHAQDAVPTPECARYEILPIVVNTEADQSGTGIINEPVALGFPVPFLPHDEIDMPQTVDEAKIAMPDGWEPIGAYGNFLLLRRCAL